MIFIVANMQIWMHYSIIVLKGNVYETNFHWDRFLCTFFKYRDQFFETMMVVVSALFLLCCEQKKRYQTKIGINCQKTLIFAYYEERDSDA